MSKYSCGWVLLSPLCHRWSLPLFGGGSRGGSSHRGPESDGAPRRLHTSPPSLRPPPLWTQTQFVQLTQSGSGQGGWKTENSCLQFIPSCLFLGVHCMVLPSSSGIFVQWISGAQLHMVINTPSELHFNVFMLWINQHPLSVAVMSPVNITILPCHRSTNCKWLLCAHVYGADNSEYSASQFHFIFLLKLVWL